MLSAGAAPNASVSREFHFGREFPVNCYRTTCKADVTYLLPARDMPPKTWGVRRPQMRRVRVYLRQPFTAAVMPIILVRDIFSGSPKTMQHRKHSNLPGPGRQSWLKRYSSSRCGQLMRERRRNPGIKRRPGSGAFPAATASACHGALPGRHIKNCGSDEL